ncbi:hypothetical protein SSX86_002042 [Deinandra increscens subsp. villosa]|uniref:Zinc-ribbon domain-containing protein n=1 Tax=Deinandra increscens subsp. villosa TaxID=3103831 RepID=A0AAP0HCR1_9ASTR
MNSKPRYVRCPRCLNVLPEPPDVPVYKCGGCGATLQAKKRNKSTVATTSQRLDDDDSSGKQKADRVFGDHEAGSSSNQQPLLDSADESDQNSSNKDQDAANKATYDSVDALTRGVKDYSYGKQKMKQLSNDHEASSSSNRQSRVNNIHNDPRSSTELSGHEDPESSPEATGHNRIDQEQEQNKKRDQDHYHDAGKKQENTTVDPINQHSDDNETCSSLNQQLMANSVNKSLESSPEETVHNRIDHNYHDDHDQVFLSCRRDVEFEESGSEFEEAFANKRIIRDSDGGSKSSFRSLIAERLLDTRRKKAVCLDEDDLLSEDGNTDLHHRRRFDRISTIETAETAGFGGTSYYESDSSVSSFDGSHKHTLRKYRIGSIGDENVDSGNGYRFNRRNQIHRFGKEEHQSTGVRPFYGLKELQLNPKHRSHMMPEDPKAERIELLKMVRELQDQVERRSISSPQHAPLYNNHVLNYPGRYGQRMAFSGEATALNRRLDGSLCHHCCPQDRHLSAQLPRQHVCCNRPHYEPKASYYSPRFSVLSSPIENHSESEFSAPDDYRHRNDITKPVHSPKKKRYVRPISGGSPWITCYRCSKLLELPQSFLVINKRYHSLRCGACLKVLNFTLSKGTHVSRYYPEETITAPPSSEVEYHDEFNGSHAAEPVSCSDRSFQKGYSTETDINGSREFSEERRMATMSRDPSGSTQPSSSKGLSRGKMTSGSKFEPRPNGSPLHRLMGYASPSKVIRGE